jgi:DNA-damage-inducible protein J
MARHVTKTATIQTRIEPGLKARVEAILGKLGLSPSDAIALYYSQIALNKGLPFEVKIPNKETRKAIQDARLRRNLTYAKDAGELMQQLGIKLKP